MSASRTEKGRGWCSEVRRQIRQERRTFVTEEDRTKTTRKFWSTRKEKTVSNIHLVRVFRRTGRRHGEGEEANIELEM